MADSRSHTRSSRAKSRATNPASTETEPQEGAPVSPAPPATETDKWHLSPEKRADFALLNAEAYLSSARSALDDFWYSAADAASEEPEMGRDVDFIHREGYAVLQCLRAAEREIANLREALRSLKSEASHA